VDLRTLPVVMNTGSTAGAQGTYHTRDPLTRTRTRPEFTAGVGGKPRVRSPRVQGGRVLPTSTPLVLRQHPPLAIYSSAVSACRAVALHARGGRVLCASRPWPS